MAVMNRRPSHRLLASVAAVLAGAACSGTNAVSQSVGGSLGYGVGNQATTWISPGDRHSVTGVTGTLLNGDRFDLSRWKGHVVVVNFWGSWCGPCVGEAPALEQVHRDTAADGVEFLGVDIKEQGRAQAETFVRAHHITYPMLYDESNLVALHFRGMPPNATPTTIVLDRQGRIAARHSGAILYTALRDLVARAQRESPQ
jgi:thiol-disulfide isomerase/thioredoxin